LLQQQFTDEQMCLVFSPFHFKQNLLGLLNFFQLESAVCIFTARIYMSRQCL